MSSSQLCATTLAVPGLPCPFPRLPSWKGLLIPTWKPPVILQTRAQCRIRFPSQVPPVGVAGSVQTLSEHPCKSPVRHVGPAVLRGSLCTDMCLPALETNLQVSGPHGPTSWSLGLHVAHPLYSLCLREGFLGARGSPSGLPVILRQVCAVAPGMSLHPPWCTLSKGF